MKHIIDDQVVLSRPPEGPLATQIAAFARYARDEGYARQSRYRRVLLAAGFSRWLGQQAVRLRARLIRASETVPPISRSTSAGAQW